MDGVIARLRMLRGWFVFWFVIQSTIGTGVALQVIGKLQESPYYRSALRDAGPGAVASSVLVTTCLLLIGLWVFHEVIRLKNWARLVLLVVGWLSVLSALSSFMSVFSLPALACLLPELLPGVDASNLALSSAVTNSLSLVLWGYVILTLQFERQVRDAFHQRAAAA